jgi:hypothetical protein
VATAAVPVEGTVGLVGGQPFPRPFFRYLNRTAGGGLVGSFGSDQPQVLLTLLILILDPFAHAGVS